MSGWGGISVWPAADAYRKLRLCFLWNPRWREEGEEETVWGDPTKRWRFRFPEFPSRAPSGEIWSEPGRGPFFNDASLGGPLDGFVPHNLLSPLLLICIWHIKWPHLNLFSSLLIILPLPSDCRVDPSSSGAGERSVWRLGAASAHFVPSCRGAGHVAASQDYR